MQRSTHPPVSTKYPVSARRAHRAFQIYRYISYQPVLPGALAHIEAPEDEHQRLLAGRQGEAADAPLMVIQVVDPPLQIEKRLRLGRTVQLMRQ